MRELLKRIVQVEKGMWLLRYGKVMRWLWKRFMKAGAYCHQEAWRVVYLLDERGLVDKAKMEEKK